MPKKDTQSFLDWMNELNDSIAARDKAGKEAGQDPERLKRDAERRERLGQLRAREHPASRRKQEKHNVFGHVDLSP